MARAKGDEAEDMVEGKAKRCKDECEDDDCKECQECSKDSSCSKNDEGTCGTGGCS
jgi:hypothetical protein